MSEREKVIARKYLPTPIPLHLTGWVTAWLYIGEAPGWLWGTTCTFLALIWVVAIIQRFREELVPPWEIKP